MNGTHTWKRACWALGCGLLLALYGCSGNKEAETAVIQPEVNLAADPSAASGGAASGETTTASGLKYVDLKVGEGATAAAGSTVVVHYTGTLKDGTKFDSSVDRNEPFEFPLGAGRVIKGWDEGVQGMKVGGKRKLIIPSALGYGPSGTPDGTIPPDSELHFDVELLEVK